MVPYRESINLPIWHEPDRVKLLGAVTDERELFVRQIPDRFTSDVTIR